MIYITGDTHRDFYRFLIPTIQDEKENLMVILGDAGINYYLDITDKYIKDYLSKYNLSFFIIQGNHEERPENISTYKEIDKYNGKVYIEEEYPNLIFAKNGEIYNIEDNKILVIGGAYSIDKYYRLKNNLNWFSDEQLSEYEKEAILKTTRGIKVDYVFTHTCPYKYIPREAFIDGISQDLVDNSMEYFLDKVEEQIDYKKWYCGHYHISKEIDNTKFMYYDIEELPKQKVLVKN